MSLRDINKNIVVYNQPNISSWGKEKDEIKSEINRQEVVMNDNEYLIEQNKQKSQNIEFQLRPLRLEVDRIEREIDHLKTHQYTERVEYSDEKIPDNGSGTQAITAHKLVVHRDENYQITNEIKWLESQRSSILFQMSPLSAQITALSLNDLLCYAVISNARSKITDLKDRFDWLTDNINQGKSFLQSLAQRPHDLLLTFTQNTHKLLEDFEENHPANQSDIVRLCIHEIIKNSNQIFSKSITNQSQSNIDRIQFHQSCGLYAEMLSRIELQGNDSDTDFANFLISALRLTHIPLDGDLPDQMQLNLNSHSHYQTNNEPVLPQELQQYEKQQYDLSFESFNCRINNLNPSGLKELNSVHDIGKKISSRINQEHKSHDKNNHHAFDIKFATTIFNTANTLLDHPKSDDVRNKFIKLADHGNKGKPSLLKKIGGSLLVLFGIAVIVGSSLAIAASFGVSTPLSLMGITVATTAVAQGLSIAAGATGTGMLLAGVGLFAHGMRKGLSKDILNFADAEQASEEYIASNPNSENQRYQL